MNYREFRHKLRMRIFKAARRFGEITTPAGERLMRWAPARKAMESLGIKFQIMIIRDQIRILQNAPQPKEEDREHIVFLALGLLELRKVEQGQLSFNEFDQLYERRSANWLEAESRALNRYFDVRLQTR